MTLPPQTTPAPRHTSERMGETGPLPMVASLTGLRWVAALAVFMYHLRNLQYLDGAPQQFLSSVFGGASAAVSLFFVLSGFVLAWSHREHTAILAVWVRRLARIWPLHLVCFLAAMLVGLTLYPAIRTSDASAGIANIFLVSAWRADWWQAGNPVSWSLVCEAFFYLAFPLLFRMLRPASQRVLWAVAAVAVTLVWLAPVVVPLMPGALSSYTFPPARLPEFCLGMVLAMLMRYRAFVGSPIWLALVVSAAGCVAAAVDPANPLSYAAFTIVGFGMLLTSLARAALTGRVGFLGHPLLVKLGNVSFAFYLIHLVTLQAVIGAASRWGFNSLGAPLALIAMVISLTAAVALHYGVERPFLRVFSPSLLGASPDETGAMPAPSPSDSATTAPAPR